MSAVTLMRTCAVPPLQPGDRLSRREFERRYRAMADAAAAELVEGIVYMTPAALRFESHGHPHLQLITWLGNYEAATPGVLGADSPSIRLDLENEPQPDCVLFVDPECGGRVRISEDDFLEGPPEFAAEVSSSSLAVDRGPKLRTFLRHGVSEYLIWRVEDRSFEWYVLGDSDYEMQEPDDDGILKSVTFPGLWLDTKAMLAGDLAAVLQTLQAGAATGEHAEFVEKLQKRRHKDFCDAFDC